MVNRRSFLKRIDWFIAGIFFFGITTKIAGVFLLPVFHDVGWYRALALFHDSAYMNLIQLEHPPLGYYFYLIALKTFGIEAYVVRLVPFIFSLIEISLVYWLARKWYGKKTARGTVFLWAFTFFAYVNALSPEGDGSIMAVFSLVLFYFFHAYLQTRKKQYLLLTGLLYGCLMLIKVRGVIFILPLAGMLLLRTKNLKTSVVAMTGVVLMGLVVFSLFPLAVYAANPEEFVQLMKQVFIHNTGKSDIFYKILHPLIFLQVVVVISPLYLFLVLVRLRGRLKEVDVLLLVWFFSIFFVLLAALPAMGLAVVYPRYISFLLPPLILLSAKGLTLLNVKRRRLIFLTACSFVVYSISHKINETAVDYWFYASAAMGVYKMTQPLLLFYLTVLFSSGIIYCFVKNKKSNQFILDFFIIFALAFNLHFIIEPIVDQTHLKLINGLGGFLCDGDVKKPLFFWAEDLAFYAGSNGFSTKLFTDEKLKSYAERIGYTNKGHFYFDTNEPVSMQELELHGGTVFTLYYPYKYELQKGVGRQKEAAYLKTNCQLLKSVVYKTGQAEAWEC